MGLFDKTYTNRSSVSRSSRSSSPSSSTISSLLSSKLNSINSGLNLAAQTAISVVNGDASNLSQALTRSLTSSVQQNRTNSNISTVRQSSTRRDPVRNAFTSQRPRSTGTFVLSPTRGTINDLNIGKDLSESIEEVSKTSIEQLEAVANRLGLTTPTNDKELEDMKSSIISDMKDKGITNGFTSLDSLDLTQVMTEAEAAQEKALSAISSEIENFTSYAAKATGNSLDTDTIKSMMEYSFTSGLPTITDATGELISGVTKDMDFDFLSTVKRYGPTALGIATDLICGGSFINYSNRMNLFNGLLSLLSRMGSLCGVMTLLDSSLNNRTTTGSTLRNSMYDVSYKGNVSMIDLIVEEIGAGTISGSSDIMKALALDGYDDEMYNTTIYSGLLTKLGITAEDVFSVESNPSSSTTVWDSEYISQTNSTITDTVLGFNITDLLNFDNEIDLNAYTY